MSKYWTGDERMPELQVDRLLDEALLEEFSTIVSDTVMVDQRLFDLQPAEIEKTTQTDIPPPQPDELGELLVSTYDLSVEAAGKLNIPIVGSVNGGTARRVVVYEWTRFTEYEDEDGGIDRWGFAIRFCVTVNKITAETSLKLPFLAAEAQLGRIEASWTMQVRGLQGPKIDSSILPPKSLDVETFVLARQSLKDVVSALSDTKTKITPLYLLRINPPLEEDEYTTQAKSTYVVAALAKARNSNWVIQKLGSTTSVTALVTQIYTDFDAELGQRPNTVSVAKARRALDGVQVKNV